MLSRYRLAFQAFNRPVRLLVATTAVASLGWGVTDLLTNLYLLRAGYTEQDIGTLVSIGAVTLALTALPLGLWVDRYSRRTALWLAVFLSAAGTGLFVVAWTRTVLYAGAVVGGLAAALMTVASPTFIAEHVEPRARAYAFSLWFAVYLLFSTLGSVVGGYLPGMFGGGVAGYRAALGAGIAALLVAAVGRLGLRDAPRSSPALTWGRLVHRRHVLHLSLTNAFLGLGAGLFVPFFNVIFNLRYGLPSQVIGWLFSVQSLVMMVGVAAAPLVSERRGTVATIALAQVLASASLVLMALAPAAGWFTLGFWLRGGLIFMVQPLHDSFRQGLLDEGERATASSLFSIAWHLGWALGARAGGELLGAGDYLAPFLGATACYTVSTLWFTLVFRPVERAMAEASARVGAGHAL